MGHPKGAWGGLQIKELVLEEMENAGGFGNGFHGIARKMISTQVHRLHLRLLRSELPLLRK
jgi:hypothetical protein